MKIRDLSALKDLDNHVEQDDLSEVWNYCTAVTVASNSRGRIFVTAVVLVKFCALVDVKNFENRIYIYTMYASRSAVVEPRRG